MPPLAIRPRCETQTSTLDCDAQPVHGYQYSSTSITLLPLLTSTWYLTSLNYCPIIVPVSVVPGTSIIYIYHVYTGHNLFSTSLWTKRILGRAKAVKTRLIDYLREMPCPNKNHSPVLGANELYCQAVCPQNGTAVLKGL